MSNSNGWVVGIIVLLIVIVIGFFVWFQNNASSNKGEVKVETKLPIGGGN